MSDIEDLIARLRNSSGVQTSDVNERVALMDEAADALEKVTVERDNWKLSAEEAERAEQRAEQRAEEAERERDRLDEAFDRDRLDEAFDRDLPWRYDEVEAQRNQLAAVVQEALNVARSNSVPLGVPEARHYDRLLAETRRALNAAPSVALDHVKAEAWDEGYTIGNRHDGRRDANPYREGADQ